MRREAIVFSNYLGVSSSNLNLLSSYATSVNQLNLKLNTKEERILNLILRYDCLVPFIDGGMAFLYPESVIRKRILLMSALIETETQYTELFIRQRQNNFSMFKILFRGALAICKGLLGVILLVALKWK
jgi:hypothetical protein